MASTPEFATVKVQLSAVSPITNVGLEPEPEPLGRSAGIIAPVVPAPSKSSLNPVMVPVSALETSDFDAVATNLP